MCYDTSVKALAFKLDVFLKQRRVFLLDNKNILHRCDCGGGGGGDDNVGDDNSWMVTRVRTD